MYLKKLFLFILFMAMTSSISAKQFKVGLILNGKLGDGAFNDSIYDGAKKAKHELNIKLTLKELNSKSTTDDFRKNIEDIISNGTDLIILNGYPFEEIVVEMANKYPKQLFLHNDGLPKDLKNILVSKFKEDEGSFLAGYLAAKVSKNKKIGFIGGAPAAVIKNFYRGFSQGAKYASPEIEISEVYLSESKNDFTGFSNPNKAKAKAKKMYSQGLDIIYSVAGQSGNGVIDAAKDLNKYVIGVDKNQDGLAKGIVITSMMKRLDRITYSTIKSLIRGKFKGGTSFYGLKDVGVSLTDMKYSRNIVTGQLIRDLGIIKMKIITGQIKVKKPVLNEK